eukprot:10909453-Heterocapsa_arctica.AAC.1
MLSRHHPSDPGKTAGAGRCGPLQRRAWMGKTHVLHPRRGCRTGRSVAAGSLEEGPDGGPRPRQGKERQRTGSGCCRYAG